MKKTIISAIIIASVSVAVLSSCNKYPDGPKVSLLTKKSRLTGDWKVTYVAVNGADITTDYMAGVGADYVLTIAKDKTFKRSGTDSDSGTWELGEDKDDVYLQPSTAGAKEESYRILRLKKDELWLRHIEPTGESIIWHYVQ